MSYNKLYFGFAVADSMFSNEHVVDIQRTPISPETAKHMVEANEVISCCNASHKPTIDAMRQQYGIEMAVSGAPQVKLESGDALIVMSVRGLPRLEGRHEYTPQEIEGATFSFSLWEVL